MSGGKKRENLGEAARRLQEQIDRDILESCGPAGFDHWRNPRNLGGLTDPDGAATVKGECGDTMAITLRLKDDIVTACGFETDGCGTTIMCGSVATEMAKGRTFIEALGAVNAAAILRVLGGLPESDVHCAELAAATLRRALADALSRRHAPWKKAYSKT
jgi:nitrogen fixation NifU-like protein